MKKLKITLAIFATLQLQGQLIASSVIIDLPPFGADQKSELLNLVHTFNRIKQDYMQLERRFVAHDSEMSLAEFGDELNYIIDTTGDVLPSDIKTKLKQLVDIKKNAGPTELLNGHEMVNDILILLINLKLNFINKELAVITKYVKPEDLKVITRELSNFRRSIEIQKQRKNYRDLKAISSDLKTILKKIEPILQELARNNPQYVAQIKSQNGFNSKIADMNLPQAWAFFKHKQALNNKKK
jgi:ElaB/YqjD/DUF883 family membrane-anchored ribosome-binding protein